MIPLFGNLFCNNIDNFDSNELYSLYPYNEQIHPDLNLEYRDQTQIQSFEKQFKSQFQSNWEVFWTHYLNKYQSNKYILYFDQSLIPNALISLWKNIFKDQTCENLFDIYQIFRKSDFVSSHIREYGQCLSIPAITLEEFHKIYSISDTFSEEFTNIIKTQLPVELLLINSFVQNDIDQICLHKLSEIYWNRWIKQIRNIKKDILSNLEDFIRFYDHVDLKGKSQTEIKVYLLNSSNFSWILDQELDQLNKDYIIKNYPIEFFNDFLMSLDKYEKINYLNSRLYTYHSKEFAIFTELLFQNQINEILSMEFNGLLFENLSEYNSYLVNLLSQKIKNNGLSDLIKFQLV